MKILHVNTYDFGGAAKACLRLHLGLLNMGIDSNVLVIRKSNENIPKVYNYIPYKKNVPKKTIGDRLKSKTKRLLREFYLYNANPLEKDYIRAQFLENRLPGLELYSFPNSEIDITNNELFLEADIIHLHWVARFLNYESFFSKCNKPIIWTLHDMFPFSGGEHYVETNLGIDNYGYPVKRFISEYEKEIDRENLDIKRKAISQVNNLRIVCPSDWLRKEAKNSELFANYPVSIIPNGIDTSIFKPHEKSFSRSILDLPKEKFVILFVADNLTSKRKGFDYLLRIIPELAKKDVHICIVGSTYSLDIPHENYTILGQIFDERLMSVVFSAADLFVIPSVMDNFPNTILESLSCGTPVVGFPVGGIPDIIEDGVNGYLCSEISTPSLINSIDRFISNHHLFDKELILKKIYNKCDLSVQANEYINLYNTTLIHY